MGQVSRSSVKATGIGTAVLAIAGLIMMTIPASETVSAHSHHDSIAILSDSDFTHENGVTRGSGTQSHPYVIAGWKITPSDLVDQQTGAAIRIENTKAFFLIRDITIDLEGLDATGVFLMNVTSGILEASDIAGCTLGAYLVGSSNVTVKENTFHESVESGVIMFTSSCIRFFHNNVYGGAGGVGGTNHNISLDDGYPSGGNYWAVYRWQAVDQFRGPGQDQPGSDGIADIDFIANRNWYFNDFYPLMKPFSDSDGNPRLLVWGIVVAAIIAVPIALSMLKRRQKDR